jgi:alkanesulfonate monooxygenase SsuD/methylene tetrahydromethanopterin reductase-like flavin-dependent oxidoreductase (luciferase family)
MGGLAERGIGIEGSIGPDAAAELAELAERRGYESFWINVVGAGVDPIGCLRQILARTSAIEIGVGLFPLDAYPAVSLAPRLAAIGTSNRRIIVGVAGGQIRQGLLRVTADAVARLRAALPACRIATGGYGPKMLELGGRVADVVLGNWLTPQRLAWLIDNVEAGAREAARTPPPVYLYHRSACGEDAVARLSRELADYRPYAGRCKIVLKPLPRDIADLGEWRSLIRFFAPVE